MIKNMLPHSLQKYTKLACFFAYLTSKLYVWALVLSCKHAYIHTYARMYVCIRMCSFLNLFWLQKIPKICYCIYYR